MIKNIRGDRGVIYVQSKWVRGDLEKEELGYD